jgi:protein-S-isoprenylcysteine O-methyltransferase Ste14
MNNLNKKASGGLIFLLLILALLTFLPAGTIQYWEAWVYLLLFATATAAITFYLMKKDPKLLEKRVKVGATEEKQSSQKVIQVTASLSFTSIFIVSSLDYRNAWSSMPLYAVIIGEMLVVVGFYVIFLVFKENTFTSATIEVDAEQRVISMGPYSVVRHPMYSGAFLMLIGTPIALGSLWGLVAVLPMFIIISLRMSEEEKFLLRNLPGYKDYCKKVHFRLMPGVF